MKTQPASQVFEKISDTEGEDGGVKYYVSKPSYDKEVSEVVYQESVETINIIDIVAAINEEIMFSDSGAEIGSVKCHKPNVEEQEKQGE